MAIVNSVVLETPGQGSPLLAQRIGIALVDGVNTIYVPSTGSLAPTCRVGTLRVKIYSGTGTSPAITAVKVQLFDGTTTEQVADSSATISLTANFVLDKIYPF